jgi:hypothetical protein
VYTIEMTHALMWQPQEPAGRSRAHQPTAAHRVDRTSRPARRADKR